MAIYGYASAPEPEALQEQVEALDDLQISLTQQYAELVNRGHQERKEFAKLMVLLTSDDTIVVKDLSALGSGLLDTYDRVCLLESMNVRLKVIDFPSEITQDLLLSIFKYLAELYKRQQELEPTGGKPRKMYPLGWRSAFRTYKSKECSSTELCHQLGLKEYDFFRMIHRYENTIARRNSEKKQK